MARTPIATLPGHAPCQRLQVMLEQGEPGDALSVLLIEEHHAQGIGWFAQHSMRLDHRQWRMLRASLGGAEIPEFIADDDRDDRSPATIPFPGPASAPTLRPAVGEGRDD